jgi:hypothetical protein
MFLTICVVLVQLFGSYNVEARSLGKNEAAISAQKAEQHYFSPAALHTDIPAENVLAQASVISNKIREQRFHLSALLFQAILLLSAKHAVIPKSFSDTPAPIPISRYLLFPQHYFW